MKKLEKLKLHDLKEICADDQKSIYGGGKWEMAPNGMIYWSPGEVTIFNDETHEYAEYISSNPEKINGSVSLMEFATMSSGSWAAGSAGLVVGGPIGGTIGFWLTAIALYIGSSQD